MRENIILQKSKAFAVRIVRLYQHLCSSKREYILAKQILRSGTSIGANAKEAAYAQSKAEFVAKMNIALKEAAETEYWLELLYETDYLTKSQYDSLYSDNNELISLLSSIIKTSNKNDRS